jgi:dihydroflavonol-4-reductase
MTDLVLVTGATGFIGAHCIVKLLRAGYRVRGTLRSKARSGQVLDSVRSELGADPGRALELCEADLALDQGWADAVSDCRYVLHVASPVPKSAPKSPDDVIRPAREGTLRVLKAAAAAGVQRVVLTSSISAIVYGHPRDGSRVYDERDWSVLNDRVGPYEQSKTLAERAAWEFVSTLAAERGFELATINPGLVLGPVLSRELSISVEVVRKLLAREVPGCPNLGWSLVDVRDVADAHIAAMSVPEARGQRFIVGGEHTSMRQIALLLAAEGFSVPTRGVPDWVLKLVGLVDKTAALAIPELGQRQDVTSQRARDVLSWKMRPAEESVRDTANSLVQLGIVKPRGVGAAARTMATLGAVWPRLAHPIRSRGAARARAR